MALYTGFGVSVVGIVGYRGLQLGTFDTITGLNPFKKDKGIMGGVSTFAAAQTAITIGAGATYPFDTIRRRLQLQSEKPVEEHLYKGTMDCFKKIASEEGLATGLDKGFVANVVQSVGGALVLVFYDRKDVPGHLKHRKCRCHKWVVLNNCCNCCHLLFLRQSFGRF